MSSLRQEYNKSKTRKEKIVSEAAINWLSENVIIINEKIDRTTVSRLIDSIQKFEETFGKFAARLPTINQYLSAAEAGLQQVITGKANDRKASTMLKKLTILYFTFSDFFSRDLPILLRAKIFDAAKEQPDVRLDMLRNRNGATYDPHLVRDALANALKPTKEEKKLLAKIYRSSLLPKLNAEEIAGQMMTLTFNELQELTQVGRVPMAATPEEMTGGQAGLPGEEIPPAEVPVPEGAVGKGEVLTEQALREAAGLLSEAKIDELRGAVASLKQLVDSAGLSKLSPKVDKLQSDLLRAMNSDAFVSYWETVKQAGSAGGARGLASQLGALFKQSPQAQEIAKLIGRTNATVEIFKSIAQAWPSIEKAIANKESLNAADVANIRKILIGAAPKQKAGLVGMVGNALNRLVGKDATEPYISVEEIVEALVGELQ